MSKRINIMLPDRTIEVLNRVAPHGSRSRFVSKAILHFVDSNGRRNLSEQLKLGYQANADDSLKIAAEWFPLEEEASQRRAGGHRGRTSK